MKTSVKLTVRMAWWFRFYAWGLITVCNITGLEPDWSKVEHVVRRAVRIRLRAE